MGSAARERPAAAAPGPGRGPTRGGALQQDLVGWRALLEPRLLVLVWIPIVAVSALHYGTSPELAWVHNVLRRVYYLPIVIAAVQAGLRGGLSAAALVSATYLPHAFGDIEHLAHTDPAPSLEKALEIMLYHLVGAVAGRLSDAERKRRSELRAALDQQKSLQRQLVRAGRLSALGQVVAGIAHEIRNPLHALQGTAEIVDPLIPLDRPERRMWEIHLSELGRLERTAERFLSFARPQRPELVPLDLRDVARRLVDLVGADARKKGVALQLVVPDGEVRVRGDRDQLAQVALNIAINAFRAVHGGGRVRVTVGPWENLQGREMHALRIENDGPLLDAEQLEHLFDPFHGDDEQGSGLGLSISERIAEQHGGYIEAANDGLGVSFTVALPAG